VVRPRYTVKEDLVPLWVEKHRQIQALGGWRARSYNSDVGEDGWLNKELGEATDDQSDEEHDDEESENDESGNVNGVGMTGSNSLRFSGRRQSQRQRDEGDVDRGGDTTHGV
jgi:hypothetical protein